MATVVGFLVISFAIWGIGDIFRGFGRSTVAKVGGTEITVEQFRMLYNERLQQISRQFGRPITMEQARSMGLDRLVIGQLISDMLLDDRARKLGLNLSDAEVARAITTDPAFQGPNGQFDRFRFEQLIRQAGYTEARFVAERRRRADPPPAAEHGGIRIDACRRPGSTPPTATATRNARSNTSCSTARRPAKFRRQRRKCSPSIIEERKVLFRAPEYRKLVIVTLIPSEQAHWIEISDAEAKRAYEERRSRYVTPERRHIQQIVFPNAEEARAAADRIAKGASFAEIAKERGLTDKDIDLGTLTKAGVIDRAVADAAFALKEGEVSAPVQGRFGTALVQVLKIEPEQVRSLRGGRAPSSRRSWRPRAPRPRCSASTTRSRTRAPRARRWRRPPPTLKLASRTIEAIDRSGRDPVGRAGHRPARRAAAADDCVLDRHRRRPRSAAGRGRLHLVRDRRHHALARAAARRGQGPGRGALARAGDRHPPQRQGDRDARQAQGRHEPRRGRRGRPA